LKTTYASQTRLRPRSNPNRIYQTGSSSGYFQNAAISEFPSGDTVLGGAFVSTMTLLAEDAKSRR